MINLNQTAEDQAQADHRVRVYLVRHGHVQYFDEQHKPINPKHAVLSSEGISQIEMLAELLRTQSLDAIYSSTMPRSIQTAQIIKGHHHQVEIEPFDAIREIRSGRLRELKPEQAEQEIKQAYQIATYQLKQFMGGESWEEFEHRVIQWFETTLAKIQDQQSFVISSHDAVNRVLLNWVYGRLNQDLYAQEQDYGCLNVIDIEYQNGRLVSSRIKLQNYTPYNPVKTNLFNSAMDDVYDIYLRSNGFKE